MTQKNYKSRQQLLLDLNRSLSGIFPGRANTVEMALAIEDLTHAIEDYLRAKIMADSKGRRSNPSLKEGRRALSALNATLAKANLQIDTLPIVAFGPLALSAGTVGAVRYITQAAQHAVGTAMRELERRPNKAKNNDRIVFAGQVAIALRDKLKVKVSSTSDRHQLTTPTFKGAGYARTLRVCLAAAGETSVNIDRLVKEGIKVMKNPHGNS